MASLLENDKLNSIVDKICSEDKNLITEKMGLNDANGDVIFVGQYRVSAQVIKLEDNVINLISDASGSLHSSGNMTSSTKQSAKGQASAEHINKISLENTYLIEKIVGKETVVDLFSSSTCVSQMNPITLTSNTSSDACKIKESFKNNGTCIACKSGGNNDKFMVACSTTNNNACTFSKTNIEKEFFTAMNVSKATNKNNACSFDRENMENIVVTEPIISSEKTPMAETRFKNETLSISNLDCSPIPKCEWRKIDASNFTPHGLQCKVLHSTPLGRYKKFQNSSTLAKRSIIPKALEEACSELVDVQSHVEKNTSIMKKKNLKCGKRNQERACSSPIMGRFKDISVSRSMSVLEEDIFDVSEDILGLEEDVITDDEIIDEEMEISLLGLDTVKYPHVKDETLTKIIIIEDSTDDEMDKTLLENTDQEETLVLQENYNMNMERKSLLLRMNTELVRFTESGDLSKHTNVIGYKTEEMHFSDNEELAVDLRKRSSQTFLFTELESGEIVSGIDNGEFDQTTVLSATDNRVFDQTTILQKSDLIEYDQRTIQEKPQVSISTRGDDVNDICNALNPTITSFDLTRLPVTKKEKDDRAVGSNKKSVAEEILTSKICDAKHRVDASCTASTKPERHMQKRRKRKLENIESSGQVLIKEFKEQKKIETKLASEEMKERWEKKHMKKETKEELEEQSQAVSSVELMHNQPKFETNFYLEEPEQKYMKKNEDGNHSVHMEKNIDNIHFKEGRKQQQIGSSSKVFLSIEMHSSQDSEVNTVSDIASNSSVIVHSLLIPEQNADEISRHEIDHVRLPLKTQEVKKNKEIKDVKLETFSFSKSCKISADANVCNNNEKLELQMENSKLLSNRGGEEKSVGCKEMTNHITSSTVKKSNADAKLKDKNMKEGVSTVEGKEQFTKEIVSLTQEHASLCQNFEGKKLIQEVQKKWKCSVETTPETNLTTALHRQRHSNTSKNTKSRLQGDRYCTLDIEAGLQLGSMADRKKAQQQLARELHALKKKKNN